jgi:subtilisin family serine protease
MRLRRGRGTRRIFALAFVLVLAGASLAAASDDPFYDRQWNLDQIGASEAWEEATGSDVLIGVVDTGVESRHPDLAGKVVASATCLGGPCREGTGEDDNSHGTEVAGIAVAVTGNGKGIAGVAPDAKLLVAKALDSAGAGRVDDINAGIRWVVDHGARVVNLSLGDPDFLLTSMVGTPLRPGIEYAWTRGAVPVLASGNYRTGVVDAGASNYGDLNALVVAATDRRDDVPRYSSAIGNAKWGLAAPGGSGAGGPDNNVITTGLSGSYEAVAGTSAAAPHVSGAVAVLLSMGLSPTAAVQRVLATLDRDTACGEGCQGRLDLEAAVADGGPPAPQVTTAPRPDSDGQPGTASTAEGTPPPSDPLLEARRQRASDSDGEDLNPVVVALAAALLLGAGGGVAVEWRRRLRAGGGW